MAIANQPQGVTNVPCSPITPMPWSDHKGIIFIIQDKQHQLPTSSAQVLVTYQEWDKINTQKLHALLSATKPNLESDVNSMVSGLNSWIEDAVHIVAPKKSSLSKRKKPSEPWYSDKLRDQKTVCRRSERKWRADYDEVEKLSLYAP